jgi:hypothetical protein
MERRADQQVIRATVPLAPMIGYANTCVRSRKAGLNIP